MYKYIFCFIFFCNYLDAQTLELRIVSSNAGYFSNDNVDIAWTLGEVITDTYNINHKLYLTQGFEQPIFKPLKDSLLFSEPQIFPNPTNGPLTILLPVSDNYELKCYDVLGQILFEENFNSNYLKSNIAYLSDAYYFFIIKSNSGEFIYRFKLLKIN